MPRRGARADFVPGKREREKVRPQIARVTDTDARIWGSRQLAGVGLAGATMIVAVLYESKVKVYVDPAVAE